MKDCIRLAHGNGGRYMRELIDDMIAPILTDLLIDTQADAVALAFASDQGQLMVTTDGFTVQPLEFPGGNIGSLAIHGTVNDLAVAGAIPAYICLNMIIEEGLPITVLRNILSALAASARDCRIKIAAGDTKVVPRGEGSGLYLATTGIGYKQQTMALAIHAIQHGDAVLVSGPVGDHGAAVLLARQAFGLHSELLSDSAPVLQLCQALQPLSGLRFMRDPTRGGLATVMHEISHATGLGIRLDDTAIPRQPAVQGVCEILGYDPLYLACEGRVVAVVAADQAEEALACWQQIDAGHQAAIIGRIMPAPAQVTLQTAIGGERLLFELEDDPLPRIC